ncbi:N-acetylmuramoyl-L-alanine amidase [Cytobacillus sp. FJAT-53684]|uniref:N-acetylmuramoyl-L-alanine amidase n=1 Tax=Cytobacillus mangrovibacter TaxID=3299024 RepID=A0ABW6K0E4_9BACI
MVKIFIDPGHGGTDPGASGNGLQEKNVTLQISRNIRDILTEYEDVQVRMSREGDQTVSLSQRTNAANAWGADFLMSVHINAGGGTGYEDYRHNKLSASSASGKIQAAIHAAVLNEIKNYKVQDRGAKSANYHMLRESNMPAVLSENLFIDTAADANLLKNNSFLQAIARGHVIGMAKALNLKAKPKEELTVAQAQDLQRQINELKNQLAMQVGKPADMNKVSSWAEKDWKEASENGYFDGTRPGAPITREETAIVINRLRRNFIELIGKNSAEMIKIEERLAAIENKAD